MPDTEHWRTEEARQIASQALGIREALRRLDDSLAHYYRADYRVAGLVQELEQALGLLPDSVQMDGQYRYDYLVRFQICIARVTEITGLPVLAKVEEESNVGRSS